MQDFEFDWGLAHGHHANGLNRAIGRWYGHAAFGHQFAEERRRFGPRYIRLHTGTHQTVGVVHGLPRVAGQH